jgi:hypothetical protein
MPGDGVVVRAAKLVIPVRGEADDTLIDTAIGDVCDAAPARSRASIWLAASEVSGQPKDQRVSRS